VFKRYCVLIFFGLSVYALQAESAQNLLQHIESSTKFELCRGVKAICQGNSTASKIQVDANEEVVSHAWVEIPSPVKGWDLSRVRHVEAILVNTSEIELPFILWVVGDQGWDAVPDVQTLKPKERRKFSCDLRETFPDGTAKINPNKIKSIKVMVIRLKAPYKFELESLMTRAEAEVWVKPESRLAVPSMVKATPSAGQRVEYKLKGEVSQNCYMSLYLPEDWVQGESYPVVVEFPGNILYVKGCYSTGRPEQCVMGYGMTKGKGSIWVSLPFVSARPYDIAEHGWGDIETTVNYTIKAVEEICEKFGGDRSKVVLTGFSRGAIACGFIGLRNDRISDLWKAFHLCQHYDGDGWGGSFLDEAKARLLRLGRRAVFQTDNNGPQPKLMLAEVKADVQYASSELGAHSSAMFLDDRASTLKLRNWYQSVIGAQ